MHVSMDLFEAARAQEILTLGLFTNSRSPAEKSNITSRDTP